MNTELAWYVERLDQLREDVRHVLRGLDSAGLNWKPLPGTTNSLYTLTQHCAWAEQGWISQVMAGQPFPHPWTDIRNIQESGEDAADVLFWLDEAATATGAAMDMLNPANLDQPLDVHDEGQTFQRTPRWIIIHILEHYAEHLGEMRLTRQLWEADIQADSGGQ